MNESSLNVVYDAIPENERTSIPLKKDYFSLTKAGVKDIHVDKEKRADPGEFVRFMKGYDPENGSVIRLVTAVKEVEPENFRPEWLTRAKVTFQWVEDYAEGETVWVHFLRDTTEFDELARELEGDYEDIEEQVDIAKNEIRTEEVEVSEPEELESEEEQEEREDIKEASEKILDEELEWVG